MESNKKELMIFTNYPILLQQTMEWYNSVFKTDFEFSQYIRDHANYAIVLYEKATDFDVFQLGAGYGRKIEAYDKEFGSSIPPDYFDDKIKYPKE